MIDWQTFGIWLGICLGSAFLLYIFSLIGTREKTYEEVMAEQREKNEAQAAKKKEDKLQKKKKYKKGKGLIDKQRSESTSTETQLSEPAKVHPLTPCKCVTRYAIRKMTWTKSLKWSRPHLQKLLCRKPP